MIFPAPDAPAAVIPTPVRVHAHPRYAGRGVTLAFLDSGFYPHPDLIEPHDRVRAHIDATGPEPAERPHFRRAEATSWHGLMVSAVAAGNGSQAGGLYRGIASQADLVLVKTGNRRTHKIPDRDIQRALRWVLDNYARYDIRVVNLSIGGDRPSDGSPQPLDSLVEEAVALGLVVVAAVGNGGVGVVIPPASARSAISVGGLDDQNSLDPRYRRMWRSSYGRGVGGVPKPDVIAPSIWVPAPILPRTWVHQEARLLWQLLDGSDHELSRFLHSDQARARFKKETLLLPLDEFRLALRQRVTAQKYIHPDYQHVDGTSMAAPIVTAIVAQMLEANPSLTPARVKDLLLDTAEPLPFVPRGEQGMGVVDGGRAVARALRATGGPLAGLPLSPAVSPQGVTFVCHAPGAKHVALAASFNGWLAEAGAMVPVHGGAWELRVPVPPPGVHAYRFLVDGQNWQADPDNPARVGDGCGDFQSLLTITPEGNGHEA